jgi:hypothetical protein
LSDSAVHARIGVRVRISDRDIATLELVRALGEPHDAGRDGWRPEDDCGLFVAVHNRQASERAVDWTEISVELQHHDAHACECR